jgi:hypothetical protein
MLKTVSDERTLWESILPVVVLADPRLRSSEAVLAAEPVSVARVKAHLRDHRAGEHGFSVCMHIDDLVATTAALIAELPGLFTSRRPLAHVCLGSPCRSIFVPVAVGRTPGRSPRVEAVHGSPSRGAPLAGRPGSRACRRCAERRGFRHVGSRSVAARGGRAHRRSRLNPTIGSAGAPSAHRGRS